MNKTETGPYAQSMHLHDKQEFEALRSAAPQGQPYLSQWERWHGEAVTERVLWYVKSTGIPETGSLDTLSVGYADSSPKGRAKYCA